MTAKGKPSIVFLTLLFLSISACEGPKEDVLTLVDAAPRAHRTCASVFLSGKAGDACELEGECFLENKCSRLVANCVGGVLYLSTEDECPACMDDRECGPQFLCLDGRCNECVETRNCPTCPEGYAPLKRNGCETCECGPRSQCDGESCADGQACVRGTVCADGCTRLDCCANVCAEPGCPEPAPLGCIVRCDDPDCGGKCLAEACACDTVRKEWICKGRCDLSLAMCSSP